MRIAGLVMLATCLIAGEAPQRGLLVACAADADPLIAAAAERVRSATTPLLGVLAEGRPVAAGESRMLAAGAREKLAWNHVIVLGLAEDPLVRQAWQHEARAEPAGWYGFGFGVIAGEVGWIESGFNPWLHSTAIAKPPYETQCIAITGSSPAGVAAAAEAFLAQGLVNGVVARTGWSRPQSTLLDRDPLTGEADLPAWLPVKAGPWTRIALTQCGADVSHGILADAGVEPAACWLVKYHRPGVWDGAGAAFARRHYVAGLHRRAFANAVLLARFADPAAAAAALPKVAAAAKLAVDGARFRGRSAGLDGEKNSDGPLSAWVAGPWLVLSTMPDQDLAP